MRTTKKRPINISNSFEEAESWDVQQQIHMTPNERQKVARELKIRVYGKKQPDIKDAYNSQ
jgi:hypothetical protein